MTPLHLFSANRARQLQGGVLLTASLLLLGGAPVRALPVGGDLSPADLQRLHPVQQRAYFRGLRQLEDRRHERQLALQARSETCVLAAGASLGALRSCWQADQQAAEALRDQLRDERRALDRRFELIATGRPAEQGWPVAFVKRHPAALPNDGWSSWPGRRW
jgi:hypothetical protein